MMGDTRPPSIKGPSILKHTSDSNNEEKQISYVIEAVKNMEYVTDETMDTTEEDSGFMGYMDEETRVKDQVEEVKTHMKNMQVDMKIMKGEAEILMEDLNDMQRDKKKTMRVIRGISLKMC